ncbi:MAG TPA: galactokinase [Cyclobacteriaceae bacterium]
MNSVDSVVKLFKEKFHRTPFVFIAPARINLIGEHTDYNDGFVMPAAIDTHMVFAVAPSGSDRSNIYAMDFDEGVTFSIHDLNPGETWINYLMGVMDGFQRKGKVIHGVDCVFGGNIPAGAGLSSSAALCSGFGFALNQIFSGGLTKLELAKIAQYAEHEFAGLMCGIMDMYASLFGEKDKALLLDCRSLKHQSVPFKSKDYSLLLIDTKVKHSLASSAYNDRRASCEEGVFILNKINPKVHSLRDVTKAMLYEHQDKLGEDTFIKCQFVIEEIDRTQRAGQLLIGSDLKSFGKLMYETHWGLSKAYDVSCAELDFLVTLAEDEKNSILGSRMMGGGFGGCTLNLISNDRIGAFSDKVMAKYFGTFKKEPDFYRVNLSEGVHQLKD